MDLRTKVGATKLAQVGVAGGALREGQYIRRLARWVSKYPAEEGLPYPELVGGSRDDVRGLSQVCVYSRRAGAATPSFSAMLQAVMSCRDKGRSDAYANWRNLLCVAWAVSLSFVDSWSASLRKPGWELDGTRTRRKF